jgi:hypothetical protein
MRPAAPSQPFQTRLTLALFVALLGAAPALGQVGMHVPQLPQAPEPAIDFVDEPELPEIPSSGRSVDELVIALDSPTLSIREAAHDELTSRRDITLEQIETALDRAELTPEQRTRLDAAALERFARGPRAAMGITWNQEFPEVAGIVQTVEGFDADKKLEPGDIFVNVGDQLIGDDQPQKSLRWQIISRDPGDILPVTVLRGKELVKLDLELGSYTQLNMGPMALPREDLSAAYRLRAERRGRVSAGPSFGLTRDDWDEARLEGKKRFSVQMQQWKTAGRPTLVAGGMPRVGADDDRDQFRRAIARTRTQTTMRNNSMMLARATSLEDPMEHDGSRRTPVSMKETVRQAETRVERLRKEVATPGGDESRRPGMGAVQGQQFRDLRVPAEVRLAAAERILEALKTKAAESGEVVDKHETGTDDKTRK